MFIKSKPIQAKLQLLAVFLFLGFSINAQNVGVNTSTPNSALEVKGNGDTDATSALNVTNSSQTSLLQINDNGRIGIGTTTPGARFMVVGQAGEPTMNIVAPTGNNPSLRVNEDGRVGVGTATPGAKFMVVGQAGEPTMNIVAPAGNNPSLRVNEDGRVGVGTATPGAKFMVVGEAGAPALNILHDGASPLNPAIRVNDNGRVGVGTTAPGARLMVVGEMGAPALNILSAEGTGATPALRVNDNGRVGIGTGAPNFELDVVGDINASGNVRANGMVLSSDERYKANIQTLNNSLAILAQIRGTSYWWKNQNISEKLQIGFIAQELEGILPNLVHTDEKGYKAVNYIGLIPVMTEAIKEQQSTIEDQQSEIDKQNERIENLETRLKTIETLLKINE